MAVDRVYAGGAVVTTVTGSMTPTVPGAGGTFTVADATGYPSVGKFPVKINRGKDDEEHIVVASRVGNVFTVSQRGADGTNAQAHAASAGCEIYFDAESANKIVDHIDGNEADPHATTLLNNARHDITARHTYGAALGTRPVPVAVGTALGAGAGSAPAAGDHVHVVGVGAINNSNMFAADVVNAAAIGAGQVGNSELAASAVDSSKIQDGTVALADLVTAVQQALIPTGVAVPYPPGGAAPAGFLLCDGAAVSRTTFAALFAAISTTYGPGNGSTTFNVPDIRGRHILGQAAAGTGSTLAITGGSLDHTHGNGTLIAQIEASAAGNNGVQWHRISGPAWTSSIRNDIAGGSGNASAANSAFSTGAGVDGVTGSANAPFIAMPYIIKT